MLLASSAHAVPHAVRYDAASGVLPEDACPAWTRTQSGTQSVSVAGGVLTISSGVQSAELIYTVPVDIDSPVVVEFRARRVSGTTSSAAREPLGIVVGMGSDVGVHFFVGPDVVFLTNGTNSRGAQASVDTDAMHTYRVEITGSTVNVYYDGVLTLTGSTFTSSPDFSPTAGIGWGDVTSAADGTSEWESVEHNSSAISCPSVPGTSPLAVVLGFSLLLVTGSLMVRRQVRA
jgi:hypothetical protein